MRKPKKSAHRPSSGPAVVLFGVDEAGKPRAASFAASQAGLAIKAAAKLKLQVLKPKATSQIAFASQLPKGDVHANGSGLVRPVRKSQFERLCAAAKISLPSKPSRPANQPDESGSSRGGPPDGS